ncbi:MAG: tRNA 2-thiouridine(34) synthase MnmA [Myxococcales bacterium]|nr:tRNA 2-thiouridine(34) synthase MnmA [Myxococcales bacterium]
MRRDREGGAERVLVAMSGGVDSSLAAALLLEQGYAPVGVTLHLWDASGASQVGRCCAPEDREDAARSCAHLGIPHFVFDEREAFRALVVDPFVQEHREGLTPSPCARCNRRVKLERLLEIADHLGCEKIATGHYCRIAHDTSGPRLLRGKDRVKDQSYFLFGLDRALLARLLFPLGELEKTASREEARRLGLPNADKPDSQELCFIPDGDVVGFLRREGLEARPGRIVDRQGRAIAEHAGLEAFTIGQRRGLGLGGGPARYVLDMLPESRELVIGPAEALLASTLWVPEARWIRTPPEASFEARVRLRHRHEPAPARVHLEGEGLRAELHEPQRAVTPGQAAVVYLDEEVLGGGFVRRHQA